MLPFRQRVLTMCLVSGYPFWGEPRAIPVSCRSSCRSGRLQRMIKKHLSLSLSLSLSPSLYMYRERYRYIERERDQFGLKKLKVKYVKKHEHTNHNSNRSSCRSGRPSTARPTASASSRTRRTEREPA